MRHDLARLLRQASACGWPVLRVTAKHMFVPRYWDAAPEHWLWDGKIVEVSLDHADHKAAGVGGPSTGPPIPSSGYWLLAWMTLTVPFPIPARTEPRLSTVTTATWLLILTKSPKLKTVPPTLNPAVTLSICIAVSFTDLVCSAAPAISKELRSARPVISTNIFFVSMNLVP
jgi:hypothetical protein